MIRVLFYALFTLFSVSAMAQEAFKGKYYCDELKATLVMNLEENDIPLKDLEFDNTYGFLQGNLNGTWAILKVKKADNKKALVRMISDMGNDAQDVELTINKEGNVELKLVDEQNIKTVADRKYVKLPKVSVFVKK